MPYKTPSDRKRRWRQMGLCFRCGAQPPPGRKLCEKCVAKQTAKAKARRELLAAHGLCVQCGKEPPREGRLTCEDCWQVRRAIGAKTRAKHPRVLTQEQRDASNQKARAKHRELVQEILGHYGFQCACCGESEPMFLEVDHIEGGGGAHFRQVGSGDQFYRWLRNQGFPSGFQILCSNCNKGRYRNGGVCPHKRLLP